MDFLRLILCISIFTSYNRFFFLFCFFVTGFKLYAVNTLFKIIEKGQNQIITHILIVAGIQNLSEIIDLKIN